MEDYPRPWYFPIFLDMVNMHKWCFVYYEADFERLSMIVCFDFTSEEFSFINVDKDMLHGALSLDFVQLQR